MARPPGQSKAVHTAGSIAVTVATIPAGGAGVVFGGLQAINSASVKIEHGATLENAMTGFAIDMAAITVGGGLNAAAAGKVARAGAPLGGAIGRAEQALGRVMQEEGRLSRALDAVAGDKFQALSGLAVDVSAMAAKGELNPTDAATSASFNALATIIGGRRGRHMPEGAAPTSVHADATPDVRVNHIADAEAVIPNHAMGDQAPVAVVQNRVSAEDLLAALPQRQSVATQANVAPRTEPVAAQANMVKPEVEVVRRTTAEAVNAEMEAAGMQPAWKKNTEVVEQIDPAGTQYRQVVNRGQAEAWARGETAAGNWATRDPIPSQSYARNELAIRPEFKADVSIELTYESTAPHRVRDGVVGPMADSAGGGGQVQFLGDKNLKVVGQRELPIGDLQAGASEIPASGGVAQKIRGLKSAGPAGPVDVNTLTARQIPTHKSGRFNEWFDARTPQEIRTMYKDPDLRKKIETGLRGDGGKHEFLMVAEAPRWSNWGLTSKQVQEDFAIKITDLNEGGLAKNWVHSTGGEALAPNSKTAHNQLQEIITNSTSLDEFKTNMRPWAETWMTGGYDSLPAGFHGVSAPTTSVVAGGTAAAAPKRSYELSLKLAERNMSMEADKIMANNPVGAASYARLERRGTVVKFVNDPQMTAMGEYNASANTVTVNMAHHSSAQDAASTIVHETTHQNGFDNGVAQNTQYAEYQAFRNEKLFMTGMRPTLAERKAIWNDVKDTYPHLAEGRSPFGGSR